jgi:hypothetical protein
MMPSWKASAGLARSKARRICARRDGRSKRLQILRDMLPAATRIAVLHVNVGMAGRLALAHEAPAKALGLESRLIELSTPENFDAGFDAAKQCWFDGVRRYEFASAPDPRSGTSSKREIAPQHDGSYAKIGLSPILENMRGLLFIRILVRSVHGYTEAFGTKAS